MQTQRYTRSGSQKASHDQIQLIRELAGKAGFEGDRGYNAAEKLLGDGRKWADSPERAQKLIDALQSSLIACQDTE
jgi:hypothetical protein